MPQKALTVLTISLRIPGLLGAHDQVLEDELSDSTRGITLQQQNKLHIEHSFSGGKMYIQHEST